MARDPKIESINCTECGAGIDVYGGGRVKALVCPYCGSVLDAQKEFKKLLRYTNRSRPDTPFEIGMYGEILGETYTIIGIMEIHEKHLDQSWTWVDHQIYSPKLGYAYLTLNRGYLEFTRKIRDRPFSLWMNVEQVEASEKPPVDYFKGQKFKYFETINSRIVFAEGEFNFVPDKSETETTIVAMSKDSQLSFIQSEKEREVEKTVLLDTESVFESFGIEAPIKPNWVHPLAQYQSGPNWKFMILVSWFMVAASLVVSIILANMGTTTLMKQRIFVEDLPTVLSFDVQDTVRSNVVSFDGDVRNSWAYVEIFVEDNDGVAVFEAGKTIELYEGYEDGEKWRENRSEAEIWFKSPSTGTHYMEVSIPESATWQRNGLPISYIYMQVDTGRTNPWWTYACILFFAIVAIAINLEIYWHYRARWRGSDWDD